MLKAVIRPDWAEQLSPEAILQYNREVGQQLLDMVDITTLGGIELNLHRPNSYNGAYPLYEPDYQEKYIYRDTKLNLALGEVAFKAYPRSFQGFRNPEGKVVGDQLTAFFRKQASLNSGIGKPTILIAYEGVRLVSTTSS